MIQFDKTGNECAFITQEEREGTLQENIYTKRKKIKEINSIIRVER